MACRSLTPRANLRLFSRQEATYKMAGMKTPQQLSREAIDEFKAIYREEFGQLLSDDEVEEIALRLLRFFGILSEPSSGETQE